MRPRLKPGCLFLSARPANREDGTGPGWRDAFRAQVTQPENCFGLIAARDWIGTSFLLDKMVKWGIPRPRITDYVSRRDFRFGLRFVGGAFGEV